LQYVDYRGLRVSAFIIGHHQVIRLPKETIQ
jgi:hypothetical protein